ncbi:MAG: hypothetical protein ABI874_13745 [Chloroflexota bacterium]
MSQSIHHDRLLVWSLATFHTAFFMAVLIALLYASGSLGALLGSLNTLVGLAIFGALWGATWFCTRASLRKFGLNSFAHPNAYGQLYILGLRWGSVNGMIFLWALTAIQITASTIELSVSPQIRDAAANSNLVLVMASFCGWPFALIIGGIFGLCFAFIDHMLLEIADRLFRMSR